MWLTWAAFRVQPGIHRIRNESPFTVNHILSASRLVGLRCSHILLFFLAVNISSLLPPSVIKLKEIIWWRHHAWVGKQKLLMLHCHQVHQQNYREINALPVTGRPNAFLVIDVARAVVTFWPNSAPSPGSRGYLYTIPSMVRGDAIMRCWLLLLMDRRMDTLSCQQSSVDGNPEAALLLLRMTLHKSFIVGCGGDGGKCRHHQDDDDYQRQSRRWRCRSVGRSVGGCSRGYAGIRVDVAHVGRVQSDR